MEKMRSYDCFEDIGSDMDRTDVESMNTFWNLYGVMNNIET